MNAGPKCIGCQCNALVEQHKPGCPYGPPTDVEQLEHQTDKEGDSPRVAEIMMLVNMLALGVAPLRCEETAPDLEGMLIVALATYAGCVHGEIVEMGLAPDLTDEALARMLCTNFRTGQAAGVAKVERLRACMEREQTGQGPVPS